MEFKYRNIVISSTPCRDYLQCLEKSKGFFDGLKWGEVLFSGFNTERHYVWDIEHQIGLALTVFKKGPARMGFLGFPVSGISLHTVYQEFIEQALKAIKNMPNKPLWVRFSTELHNVFLSNDTFTYKTDNSINTCIDGLNLWRLESSKKIAKDIKYAEKKCSALTLSSVASGTELYELYRAAVTRNTGSVKYTAKYFAELQTLTTGERAKLYVLRNDSEAVGMMIVVYERNTAYYIHGGTNPNYMRLGVNDFLMRHAIQEAKENNLSRFDFMSSPIEQAGLIKFKEKWGGRSKNYITYTVATSLIGRILLRFV